MSTLRLISSMATKPLLADLVALYAQHHPGVQVQVESVGGVDAAKRVAGGEAFDVVFLASDAMGFVGLLSAVMGVGGGFILVPAMIYLLRMPTNVVVGTSLFQIIFVTAMTTLLQASDEAGERLPEYSRSLEALVDYYTSTLREVDRLQREFEQVLGEALAMEMESVAVVQQARASYRKALDEQPEDMGLLDALIELDAAAGDHPTAVARQDVHFGGTGEVLTLARLLMSSQGAAFQLQDRASPVRKTLPPGPAAMNWPPA